LEAVVPPFPPDLQRPVGGLFPETVNAAAAATVEAAFGSRRRSGEADIKVNLQLDFKCHIGGTSISQVRGGEFDI
jgi:hypothetical protein